jgi:hypothetical protein
MVPEPYGTSKGLLCTTMQSNNLPSALSSESPLKILVHGTDMTRPIDSLNIEICTGYTYLVAVIDNTR